MADSPAIAVREVSKKYRLYTSARHRLLEALHPFQRTYHREFWALKGVSFEVPRGQTVGIIGRNGSGKSTLLQIVCSILRPTTGEVAVAGRVSALLELGTGFNPEFTGRDNVEFYCQLMGVPAEQIPPRLIEIEAFADIGQFFDQPVKTYSSGMFVRLGFAAAIHVDPEVFIVDEALAVGDAPFQHKCYRKFLDFQRAGKTILFVSHNTDAVIRHCDRAILLEQGQVVHTGEPNDVVNRYMDLQEGRTGPAPPGEQAEAPEPAPGPAAADSALEAFRRRTPAGDRVPTRNSYNRNEYRQGSEEAAVVDYLLVAADQIDPVSVRGGQTIDVYLKAKFHRPIERPLFGIAAKTVDGVVLFGHNSAYLDVEMAPVAAGEVIVFKYSLKLNVAPGDLFLDIGVGERTGPRTGRALDRRCAAVHLEVRESGYFDGLSDLEPACEEIARHTGAE